MKFVWKVDPEPTGCYRSFYPRGWPCAELNGEIVLSVYCPAGDNYTPARARGCDTHGPLRVKVTDRREKPWVWRTLKGEFVTLAEAKEVGERFLRKNPEILGKKEE